MAPYGLNLGLHLDRLKNAMKAAREATRQVIASHPSSDQGQGRRSSQPGPPLKMSCEELLLQFEQDPLEKGIGRFLLAMETEGPEQVC